MQRVWLLLGSGVLLLVLFAAGARAQHPADEPGAKSPADEATREAEKKEESDIFKGALDLSIWTIVVFLVLFFVLRKFAWGPMMEGLENREKNIRGELESAQKANADAQALRSEFERKINEAQQQVRAMIDEARKNGEQLKTDLVNQGTAAIQAEKERARRELQTEAEQERVKLFQQVTQLASLVSAKAVRRQLTIEDQHRLVDEALNDLGVAANERQRVLASIQ
jgi:F-type H+-transporting ATPase subunit b